MVSGYPPDRDLPACATRLLLVLVPFAEAGPGLMGLRKRLPVIEPFQGNGPRGARRAPQALRERLSWDCADNFDACYLDIPGCNAVRFEIEFVSVISNKQKRLSKAIFLLPCHGKTLVDVAAATLSFAMPHSGLWTCSHRCRAVARDAVHGHFTQCRAIRNPGAACVTWELRSQQNRLRGALSADRGCLIEVISTKRQLRVSAV